MNPADPRISQALQEIEAVYAGHDTSHAYYDPNKKVYVLVVSGAQAEAYHNALKAIHALTATPKRGGGERAK
jgi:hypothetical protein